MTAAVRGPRFIVDSERWPLVNLKPPSSEHYEPDVLNAYLGALEAIVRLQKPCVTLLDLAGFNACERSRQALIEWSLRHDASIRRLTIALAVLVSTTADHEFVTIAFWELDQSYYARMFTARDAAERWLLSEYERHEHEAAG